MMSAANATGPATARCSSSDYCKLQLLYIWNPLIDSLRVAGGLGTANVARALGSSDFRWGVSRNRCGCLIQSNSRRSSRNWPQTLRPLADQRDSRLSDLKQTLTTGGWDRAAGHRPPEPGPPSARPAARPATTPSLDGPPSVRLAAAHPAGSGPPSKPTSDRTGARNAGKNRENSVLRNSLQAGRCYVGDGGYADRSCSTTSSPKESCYVIRLQENARLDVKEGTPAQPGGPGRQHRA